MNRLTYKTAGDTVRRPRYCAAPGVKKDDLIQRLGLYEDENTCGGCTHCGDDNPICDMCVRNYEEDYYEPIEFTSND